MLVCHNWVHVSWFVITGYMYVSYSYTSFSTAEQKLKHYISITSIKSIPQRFDKSLKQSIVMSVITS